MKIKLKLNNDEFNALYEIYEAMVLPAIGKELDQKLLIITQQRIYKKMYALAVDNKPKYSLVLDETESLGYLLYWQRNPISNDSYTGNLINHLLSIIHPKFV